MGISTHVLDIARGRPAEGIEVRIDRLEKDGHWRPVGRGTTDQDGRVSGLLDAAALELADYRVYFRLEEYLGPACFFPEATIHFRVTEPTQHYHVPLLLSPFGYSTYRGS